MNKFSQQLYELAMKLTNLASEIEKEILKPKEWCQHIKWINNSYGGYWEYKDETPNSHGICHSMRFFDPWKKCPTCGTNKP